jgi:hypothetical protein
MSPGTPGPGPLDGLFDLTGSVALVTGGNGGVAVYLASRASAFHTADEFRLDGGFAAT